jgi:hypothetical protein
VGLERTVAAHHIGHLVGLVARQVEGLVVEHIARADKFAVAKLVTQAGDPRRAVKAGGCTVLDGDRHKRAHVRIHPSTRMGEAKGSRISPTAGKVPWARTMQTGSSLPTYLPAISDNFSVEEAAAISPLSL